MLVIDVRSGDEAPPSRFEALGMGVAGLGDLDGDGIPDLGVETGPNDDAVILSGADGRRLAECLSDDVKVLKHRDRRDRRPGRRRGVRRAEGLEKCSSSFSLDHSEDLRKEPMAGQTPEFSVLLIRQAHED